MIKLIHAFRNSLNGLKLTWAKEQAFRLEILGGIALLPFLYWIQGARIDKILVLFSFVLLLIVELLNTGIEKANDAHKKARDPLVKFSKDAASAAVFLAMCLVGISLGNLLFFS